MGPRPLTLDFAVGARSTYSVSFSAKALLVFLKAEMTTWGADRCQACRVMGNPPTQEAIRPAMRKLSRLKSHMLNVRVCARAALRRYGGRSQKNTCSKVRSERTAGNPCSAPR